MCRLRFFTTSRWIIRLLVIGLLFGCATPQEGTETALELGMDRTTILPNRARIVFFGDSITEAGVGPGGYVTLVKESLKALYPGRRIDVIGSGVSGNRVPDLQARLERDVLSKKPTHVVVYIGVNDVGHRPVPHAEEGADKEAYRRGLKSLLTRIQRSGAEAILCTPGVIGEDPSSGSNENRLLDDYAVISRRVAAEAGAGLCDLRAAFRQYLKMHNTEGRYQGILTYDGLHLNEAGNRFVARQMLRAFNAPEYLPS